MSDPESPLHHADNSADGGARSGLVERLLEDQRSRDQTNQLQPVEAYLARHPDLTNNREGLLDLIYQEMVIRRRRGLSADVSDYQRRFPGLADELRIQAEIDRGFDTNPGYDDESSRDKSSLATSESLLERLKNRQDQQAWQRFLSLYAPVLQKWARRLPISETEADDLIQEILLILVDKLPEFEYDPTKSFRGWLYTVSQNKWREHWRRRKSRIEPTNTLPDELPETPADSFWDGEFQQRVITRAFHLLRSDFSENTVAAFEKSVLEGRSPREVADELGMSLNAVYLAKHHVLRKLRQELAGLED